MITLASALLATTTTKVTTFALGLLAQATPTVTSAPAPTGTGAAPTPPGWFQGLQNFGPIILIVIVFWFMMSSSKRKQDRERSSLLDNLKRGDRVKLIGGEYGAVVETKDGRVLVKVDEGSNTKIWYAREAVASVEKDAVVKEDTK